MKLSEQHIDLIESYLEGRLGEQDALALRTRLEQDAAFRTAVTEWQRFKEAMRPGAADLQLREQIRKDLLARREARARAKRKKTWLWAFGAAAASLAGLYFFFMPSKKNDNPIIAYLKPYSSPGQTLSTQSPKQENGYVLYEQKRYAEAIPVLRREFEVSGGTDSIRLFYAGIAALWNNEPQDAKAIFRNFQGSTLIPQSDNRWFLALSYWQGGQKDSCLYTLDLLKSNPNWSADAKRLEEKIKAKNDLVPE